MRQSRFCLYGGPLFDGERLLPRGTLVFNRQKILQVYEGDKPRAADAAIDVRGQLISAGLVDLHSDALEKCIEMRPGVFFDPEFALQNLDRRVAACGITTFCHAVSFADNELGLRSCEEAENLVRLIRRFAKSPKATVRHLVHLRCEVSSSLTIETAQRLAREHLVDLLSFMDHTPGQGQFKTLQSYLNYYTETYKISQQQASSMADRKMELRDEGWQKLSSLARSLREASLPILSHDDDSAEKVVLVNELGATAAEFPVTMAAAVTARERSMKVFMGAPNLIRGCSSNGHLRAIETIAGDVCDGLLSDYYPECLLQAPFLAAKALNLRLEKTLKLVTSNPGDYLGPQARHGWLLPEMPADVVVVDCSGPWARVTQTWVEGKRAFYSDH